MPTVSAGTLEKVTYEIFRAVGTPEEDARITAHLIVESNLTGHESHGVLNVPRYIDFVKKGYLVPGSPTEVVQDEPTYALIDGHKNFGHIVTYRATQLAIEKARKTTIACVGTRNVRHIGRLGAYPEMIAKAGLGGIICANGGGPVHNVAPYGGAKGRIGTNPIAMAFPSDFDGPILLDMATTVHAAGKVAAYQRQGIPFPSDWLLDSEGRPTTDPRELRKGGAMRTFGGQVGYKGFGLAFFVEIFAGILARNGSYSRDTGSVGSTGFMEHYSNGSFIIAISCESFLPLETLKREISDLTAWIKSSPPAEGFDEILYPGELEARRRKERLASGIPLDNTTWDEIKQLVDEYNVGTSLTSLT